MALAAAMANSLQNLFCRSLPWMHGKHPWAGLRSGGRSGRAGAPVACGCMHAMVNHGDRRRQRPSRWPQAIAMILHGVHAASWSGCSCATETPPRPQPCPWMLPMHPWKRLGKEVLQQIGYRRRWSHRAAAGRLPWSTSFDSLKRLSNARHFS